MTTSDDEDKRRRTAIVSSSPDANDNDDSGFADFLTLLATPATISTATPLGNKNDTINSKEDAKKDIVDDTNKTTPPNNSAEEEEQRIKQFNKTLEQIMIRREDGETKKNGKQQPTNIIARGIL